jgi:glycosyltransferase involved in cell wall biosynthesis
MKILQLFGLGDTSTLLTVALRRLGADCDLLLSNRAFVTQYPAWTKKYPELEHGCYHWDQSNMMDPRTVSDLYRFIRDYDLIFCHPPGGAYAWHFDTPFTMWDGGSGNFIMSQKHDSPKLSGKIEREVVRRSYKKAKWCFFNDINVIYLAWHNVSWAHDRYSYTPLPVDTEVFQPMDVDKFQHFVVYLPTRQEVWIKGIEEILQGFKMFTTVAPDAKLWMTRYGSDVPVTEHLIYKYDLEDYIQWIPLVPKTKFAEIINKAHVVIDQLKLNALGGVADQAMACEQRVIVAIKEEWYKEQLGDVPPVLVAHTAEDVYFQLTSCYTKTHHNLKKKARKFILKHFEYNKVAHKVNDILQEIAA